MRWWAEDRWRYSIIIVGSSCEAISRWQINCFQIFNLFEHFISLDFGKEKMERNERVSMRKNGTIRVWHLYLPPYYPPTLLPSLDMGRWLFVMHKRCTSWISTGWSGVQAWLDFSFLVTHLSLTHAQLTVSKSLSLTGYMCMREKHKHMACVSSHHVTDSNSSAFLETQVGFWAASRFNSNHCGVLTLCLPS